MKSIDCFGLVLLVLCYEIIQNNVYGKDHTIYNWHDANKKCQLLTLHDVNNKKTSLPKGHAAWIQTTVLLSDWGYFLGCVPKSLNSKMISDIQKSLQRWFPESNYPYNVKNIFECILACTNRHKYQYFIYVRNVCQCVNQSDKISWQPTTTCIGACEGTDIFCTSGSGLPMFGLYDSMAKLNTFESRTSVPSGHQCYSTSEQPIRSCKERMKFVCYTSSYNGTNSTWYDSTHECFTHATTLIQFSQNLTSSLPKGIWLQYFRNMQLILKSDEVIYYDGSRRCLVAIRHKETVLIKIVYCSESYAALCATENTDDIFKAISTTKENTYAVTVYENDFDKTSSSMISYTQTDSAVEHQNLTEIHIINIFLLGGLLFVLIAVLWKVYLKSRVRCYDHATELASNQRTTEQPDSTVDDLDGSETFGVHYSVINDLSYM